ncbi:hypothetical protein CNR22_21250 [Sphingobacteriaceae bacterium]|nr:hypothetical protein CNR22_21250 [Sphingobacteriaceae bacterium]
MIRPSRLLFLNVLLFLSSNTGLKAQSVLVKGSAKRITLNREIKVVSGEIHAIKGIRDLVIKFDYTSKRVCSFPNDQAFVDHIKRSYSEKKGRALIDEWNTLPRKQLENKFTEIFNKNAADIGLFAQADSTHPLPFLLIRILHEDPHFHTGVDGMPPNITLECTFFDKEGEFLLRYTLTSYGSKQKVLMKRFEECYEIAGKMLARDLTMRMLKYDEQNFKKD